MNRPSRLKLKDANSSLICFLCGGYFIDATTIVECLHSFCKTCIVRYFESSKYCPVCDVQVHKTKPLLSIRSDHTLQNIVYKLVPGLFQNEMRQRREFYSRHPEAAPVSECDAGVINEETSYIYSPDETVALCLEYFWKPSSNSQAADAAKVDSGSLCKEKIDCHQHRRYLRCPAAVTVAHLKKLLRSKYGLSADHRVDLIYNEELLREDFSLMDVAYVYLWKRKGPMHLTYRIFERPHKRRKLDLDRDKSEPTIAGEYVPKQEAACDLGETKTVMDSKVDDNRLTQSEVSSVPELDLKVETDEVSEEKCDTKSTNKVPKSTTSDEWKEVQLQISENGIMSVRNMDDLISAVECGMISETFNETFNETLISGGKAEEGNGESEKKGSEVNSTVGEQDASKLPAKIKDVIEELQGPPLEKQPSPVKSKNATLDGTATKPVPSLDKKDVNGPLVPALSSKVGITEKNSGPRVSDVSKHNYPKKETNLKPKDVKSKESNNDLGISAPSLECLPLNNCSQTSAPVTMSSISPCITVTPITPTSTSSLPSVTSTPKRSNSTPVGYKTLKTPPKTWNPSIPRASFLANHATFGKSGMGGLGNVNGSVGSPGQSISSSKVDGKTDGKVNPSSVEGSSNNGVRLPPSPSLKPLRFFKMRNNMPRYLGNPSSGVKPMYQVQPGGGGSAAAAVSPKPSSAKVDSKVVNTAPNPPPTTSASSECQPDKSGTVSSKVAFPISPLSRSNHKSQSGTNTATGTSAGQSAPTTFSHTPISSAVTSHATTQLPIVRTTTQSMSPFGASTTITSSGYHPSLPPSISMIFGPSRPAPTNERPPSQTPPPAVQRVPASVHHSHNFHHPHPVTPIHLLQHRQVTKTPGKLNGELGNGDVKSLSKSITSESPSAAPQPILEAQKVKDGPSREILKESVNGKLEGSSTAAKTPIVEGKSMAPSKC